MLKKTFILFVCLLLAGCGVVINEGEVIHKEFVPEHTETTFLPVTTVIGEIPITNVIPITNHVPDEWFVEIRNVVDDKVYVRRVRVNKSTWDSLKIGDWVKFNN